MSKGATDQQSATGKLDENGRRVASIPDFACAFAVGERLAFPQEIAVRLVESDKQRVASASSRVHELSFYERAFAQAPRDVFSFEAVEQIHGPHFAATL